MPTKKLKFHEAMNRLYEIVTELNRDDLELEKAMDLFTEGTKLAAQCETQLKEFEQKVEQLSNQKETTND